MKRFITILILICINFCHASEIVILHTSDTHGRISPIEYNHQQDMGGLSKRVKIFNDEKENNENILLLDSGDVFQGSIYYKYDKGKLNSKLLRYLHYDAIALGNHEFDDGIKILKRNIKLSKTTFISSNIHFKNKYLNKHVKPYITKEINGEKILIIGATTQSVKSLSKTNKMEVTVTDPVYEIKKIINNNKYDKLILLSHCGIDEDRIIADSIPQIDLILGGHNHLFFDKPEYENNVPIIQDGEFGVRTAKISLDNGIKNYEKICMNSSYTGDEKIDKIISKTENKIKKHRNMIVAETKIKLIGNQYTIEHNQTNLGKLVLISMAKPFKDYDVVLTNSGSIRINKNLSDKITYADLLEMLPFDNKIVMVELQGKYLKQCLHDGSIQTNRRYLQVYLKNQNIDDKKIYKVITNDYIASGKDGYTSFLHGRIVKRINEKPVKLLYKTIKEMKIITEENLKF